MSLVSKNARREKGASEEVRMGGEHMAERKTGKEAKVNHTGCSDFIMVVDILHGFGGVWRGRRLLTT